MRTPSVVAALMAALVAPSVGAQTTGDVGQIYTYRLTDRKAFVEGYRTHLRWHAGQKDALVWYGWTVSGGPRTGLFIDGTFGATFAGLDNRPDLSGDSADFAATAGLHATALGNETWRLWRHVSTAAVLEAGKPSQTIDVFRIVVLPGHVVEFDAALSALAGGHDGQFPPVIWYRLLRGAAASSYMLMVPRDRWQDIDRQGDTLIDLLVKAYGARREAVAAVLARAERVDSESWSYEPRLSLFPGVPLAP